ncbi:MAG: molecular chaperone TorD family protein [Desulfobacteraceae bacterium]|jgi:TorA maturation chaperone TorD
MVKSLAEDIIRSRAEMAGARATVYDLLVGIFGHLPDEQFLARIRGDDFNHILDTLSYLKSARCESGIGYLQSFQSAVESKAEEEVLDELSVDRTRILRGTGHPDLKPPYEGLYKTNRDVGQSLLEVKRFYRKAGILPEETIQEPPDYICIELDFMKRLCLREQDQWESDEDVLDTISTEEVFLREHLGGWVCQFCQQVEKHALTDFYRGLALILEAVVLSDMQYMGKLLQTLKR